MDFDTFLSAELPGLTRLSGVLTGNRQDAHDVLADALLIAGARWDRIGAMQFPAAYVRRVVVTTFLADRRTRTRRATEPTGDPAALDRPVTDVQHRVDDRDTLDRLLERLPSRQRAAVVLRYYLDLDDAAIAEILDCSPGTVRSTLSRALTTLRISASTTATSDQP